MLRRLSLLLLVLASLVCANLASAKPLGAAKTRVWAIDVIGAVLIGGAADASARWQPEKPAAYYETASGNTLAAEGGEVFYRTMSAAHAAELQATGRVAATTETFISRTQAFSEAYEGVLVQFRMQAGTTEQLAAIGVRDASALSSATYPGMPLVGRGWTAGNAFFKAEGAQINIGLGRGAALDVFNSNIAGFNVIRW